MGQIGGGREIPDSLSSSDDSEPDDNKTVLFSDSSVHAHAEICVSQTVLDAVCVCLTERRLCLYLFISILPWFFCFVLFYLSCIALSRTHTQTHAIALVVSHVSVQRKNVGIACPPSVSHVTENNGQPHTYIHW